MDETLYKLIESEDYIELSKFLILDVSDNMKCNFKRIMTKCCSKSKIEKFLSNLLSVLNNNLSLWENDKTIKTIFNELEEASVKVLSSDSEPHRAQKVYDEIVEDRFNTMFNNIRKYLEKSINDSELHPTLCETIINFTKLVDIRGFDAVLFPMAQFAELLLTKFVNCERLQSLSVNLVVHINYRLINYLAVTPGHPTSKGLREAISIYDRVRKGIIDMIFVQPEVISVALSILEHRSRFFGMTADAISENENHGDYIVIDPLNAPVEDDDVYDDYEKFLADLPN